MSSIPSPPFAPLFGSLYFATVISAAFYGMACMQIYIYFIRYQNDPLRTKGFAVLSWASNTGHQALLISGTYKYFKLGIESPIGWIYGIPDFILGVLLTTLVSLPTQGFFVYRIYMFSGKKVIVPIVWVFLAACQLVLTLLYVAKGVYVTNGGIKAVNVATLGDTFYMDISIAYCAVTAGVDVIIAISMAILLTRRRSVAGYKSTSRQLQRLIIFAIVSGIWTAVFALLATILLHVYPLNLIYTVFSIPLCPLYCNTLLANLNARSYMRGESTHRHGTDVMLNELSGSDPNKSTARSELISRDNLGVWKTTEVVTFSETPGPSKGV